MLKQNEITLENLFLSAQIRKN